ncbi:MAG: glutathione S-transferase [Nannocystaceae bacterium]
MQLYFTPTSPYVRKVLVAAHELGLRDRIETTFLRPVPMTADPTLSALNPLSKIPALVTDEGALYDSAVICEYLDALEPRAGGPRLIPPVGPDRWRTLRVQALCDGILEAAILVFYETSTRPAEHHWAPWLDGQRTKAIQGLDALEREAASFGEAVDLGQISAAVTFGWLEFRGFLGDPRAARPTLSAWFDRFRQRPSMQATEPPR